MRAVNQPILKTEVNGCMVTLSFAERPGDGVIENIQSILSNAYDERVQEDLTKIVNLKGSHG